MTRCVMVVMVAALGLGCDAPLATSWTNELSAARRRWEATRTQEYSYDLRFSCCRSPGLHLRVFILDLAPVSVVDLDSDSAVDPVGIRDYLTIDRLFVHLENEISRGPQSFDVTYDPSRGYPTSVAIDVASDGPVVAISNLQVAR